MRRFHADLLILFIALIWGLAFFFQKIAMDHVGPLLFVALRSAVATLVLAPLAVLEARAKPGLERRGRQELHRIAAWAAAMFFTGAVLQQWGLITATVTNSGFLTGLYVVIVPLVLWLLGRGLPTPIIWLAIAMSFAGTWLLGGGTVGGFSTGDWLVVIGAVFWAAHVVVVGDAAGLDRPIAFTALQFAGVTLLAGVGTLLFETPSIAGMIAALPAILFVGVLSSALTFTMLAVAMRYTPPSEAAILMSLETVFAAFAGALLLGERLGWLGWAGAGILFAATVVVQLGPQTKAVAGREQP